MVYNMIGIINFQFSMINFQTKYYTKKYTENDKSTRLGIKILAIKMFLDGKKRRNIGEKIGVSYNTILRWVKRYNSKGWTGLNDRAGRGNKSKLLSKEMIELKEVLKKQPSEIGAVGKKWTGKILAMYIKKNYGIEYKKSRVYEILKKLKIEN